MHRTRTIDYGGREKLSMAVAWGDVSTAYHSTGIPNIEVYMPAPRAAVAGAKLMSRVPGLVGSSAVQGFLKRRVDSRPDAVARLPDVAAPRAGAQHLRADLQVDNHEQ